MEGKTCIVTGSNTGIGKETARALAEQGARVVLACRSVEKAGAAREEIIRSTGRSDVSVEKLDLSSIAAIKDFAARFADTHDRLDVLVNNAGLWPTVRSTTTDGFETTFGVNHLGTQLLTCELLPLLKKSAPSRIVVLSSALHYRGVLDFDDPMYENKRFAGPKAYSQSKLANVMFTLALARRLQGTGVTVNAVHPGVVATELARDYPDFLVKIFHLFLLTPEQGARCSLHVATSPELENVTGKYFEKCREKRPSRAALDEDAQERLWQMSEELLSSRGARAA